MEGIICEVCVEILEQCCCVEVLGVDWLELCVWLDLGGIMFGFQLVKEVLKQV